MPPVEVLWQKNKVWLSLSTLIVVAGGVWVAASSYAKTQSDVRMVQMEVQGMTEDLDRVERVVEFDSKQLGEIRESLARIEGRMERDQ